MTTVPDGLPTLSAGPQHPSSGRACVMQYVSVIAGEEWSDFPACTNKIIARVAQVVNDSATDEFRHKLVPYIDRLYSAGGSSPEFVDAAYEMLTDSFKQQAADCYSSKEEGVQCCLGYMIMDEMSAIMYPGDDIFFRVSREAEERAMDCGLKFLDRLLQLHDELVKPVRKEVSPEALAAAKRLIETRALINT